MAVIAADVLKDLLKSFPRSYVNYCFAYGSAVFPQNNRTPGKMIDLIFTVDNPREWHKENLSMNPDHYSGLKIFGSRFITTVQENMGAGIYFNPYCQVDGRIIKYGIISTKKMEEDCNGWKSLYIAGRLHKPVLDLVQCNKPSTIEAIKKNHEAALAAALLQHKNVIEKWDLFRSITQISYIGDTRMMLAESPNKVKNIVGPLMEEFNGIYMPLVKNLECACETSPNVVQQDVRPDARYLLLMSLPDPIQREVVSLFKDPNCHDIEEVLGTISYLPDVADYVRMAIKRVVRSSSLRQTVKGFFTAGPTKSVQYALEKVGKRFQRVNLLK